MIEYSVSGGFAGIHRQLTLSNDGHFTTTDQRTKERVELQASEEQLASIAGILEQLSFSVDARASSKSSGQCADCFQYSLTLTANGRRGAIVLDDLSLGDSKCAALIGLLSTMMASHTVTAAPTPADARSGNVLTIAGNTQATLGDVRIGVGNIWEEPYKDKPGVQKKGLTAALWIYVRDDAAKDAKLRVHPGQKFTAGKQVFEVVAVEADRVKIRVVTSPELRATPQPSGSATMTASIGVATMEADGTIVLQLRAEGPGPVLGDGRLTYPRRHKDYDMVLKHVGGLKPGESKPVPPWPD